MAPLATLLHRAVSIAVGLAAKRRKAHGSTPSTAASDPFTRTRAASTGSAARTPGRPRTLATVPAGSGSSDTTSTSAGSSLRAGAGEGELPPAGSALGGRPGCGGASIAMAGGVAPPGPGDAPAAGGEPAATTSSEPTAIRTGRPAPRSLRPGTRGPPGTRRPRIGTPETGTPKTRIPRTRISRTLGSRTRIPRTNIPRACQDGAWAPGNRMPRLTTSADLRQRRAVYPPAGHHYPAGAGDG